MTAFNPQKPNIARIYDALRDGKDNFGPDRDAAGTIRQLSADGQRAAHDNREFLGRTVRFLAREEGISQFLDIGTGMPADQNTHEIACDINPEARAAYIDYDQVVTGHVKAMLEDQNASSALPGDLRDPAEFLDNPVLRRFIDFRRPVAVMLLPSCTSSKPRSRMTPEGAADRVRRGSGKSLKDCAVHRISGWDF
jgi:hypothetical protein